MALHAAPREVTLPVLVALLVLVVLEIAERRLGVLTAGARLAAGGLATARAAAAKLRTKKPKAVKVKGEEEELKPAEKPPAPTEAPAEMESVLRRVKRRHRT